MRVLRFLSSFQLTCGCLVGVYELYSGKIANVIDEVHDKCGIGTHKPGQQLETAPVPEATRVAIRE